MLYQGDGWVITAVILVNFLPLCRITDKIVINDFKKFVNHNILSQPGFAKRKSSRKIIAGKYHKVVVRYSINVLRNFLKKGIVTAKRRSHNLQQPDQWVRRWYF